MDIYLLIIYDLLFTYEINNIKCYTNNNGKAHTSFLMYEILSRRDSTWQSYD
jgi:hypothetical protein